MSQPVWHNKREIRSEGRVEGFGVSAWGFRASRAQRSESTGARLWSKLLHPAVYTIVYTIVTYGHMKAVKSTNPRP